ncbi:MAG TPA: hypothetical protein VND64_04820 [Pirellulales bacterium]|nr:hypothetical protein [Pirellulales bacterium]
MPRFRFSLLALFWFIAATAIGCAAVAKPNVFWVSVVASAGLVVLIFVPIGALFCRNAIRAFWAGFALAAWGYMCFRHLHMHSGYSSALLPTTRLLVEFINARGLDFAFGAEPNDAHRLLYIGEMLWSLLLGFIGGIVARYLYIRRERESSHAT